MANISASCIYFEGKGAKYTEETLALAKSRAEERGIRTIIVASTRGDTGARAAELFQDYSVVVVTHCTGHRGPNTQELTPANAEAIRAHGGKILTCQHAFGGIGRAVRRKFNTYQTEEIVANVYRTFCEGMKVVVEMALMAADAGLVRTDEEIIAIVHNISL